MKKILGLALIVLILLFVSLKFSEYRRSAVFTRLDDNTVFEGETSDLKSMLDILYQDEYNTKSTYEEIIDEFGPNILYNNLIQAEAQHMSALERVYVRYDIQVPDLDAKTPNLPDNVLDTYTLGKEAEEANIALYDKYLEKDLPEDMRFTFERLMNASYHHLDAFNQAIANDGDLDSFYDMHQGGGMRGRNFRSRP